MNILIDENGVRVLDCGKELYCDHGNVGDGIRMECWTPDKVQYTVHLVMSEEEQEGLIKFLQEELAEKRELKQRKTT